MKVKKYNFYTVFSWMTTELKLSGNELAVFAIIYSFSQDNESYFMGSLSYIQEFLNVSRPTVISILDKLINKSLIVKESYLDGALPRNRYKVTVKIKND